MGWECLAGFYVPVSALLLVNVFFYWTAQKTMARQMLYNRYISITERPDINEVIVCSLITAGTKFTKSRTRIKFLPSTLHEPSR